MLADINRDSMFKFPNSKQRVIPFPSRRVAIKGAKQAFVDNMDK